MIHLTHNELLAALGLVISLTAFALAYRPGG
jgi:hypothetical protein